MRSRAALLAVSLLAPIAAITASAAAAPAPSAPESSPLAPHVGNVVLIGFRPGTSGLDRAAARRTVGAVASERISPLAPDAEKLTLPAGYGVERAIAALAHARGVRYAEPD